MAKNEKEDKKDEKKKERQKEKDKKKKQKDFLKKLKEEINNSKEFVFVCPNEESIENYIWVGKPGGLIGTAECHYEILFDGKDKLKVEAHFEDDNFEDFRDIKFPEEAKEKLKYEYKKYTEKKQGMIVYANDTGIANTGDTKEVMNVLRELDGLIGEELKRIV